MPATSVKKKLCTSFKSSQFIKIINKILLKHYTTFLDAVLDMKFFKGKNSHYMNQNFEPFSEDMKEAFDAVQPAAIALGTYTRLEHIVFIISSNIIRKHKKHIDLNIFK
eukprot:128359_1